MKIQTQGNARGEDVLRVFQKVNPSAVGIEDASTWRDYSSRLINRFVSEYKLPVRVFRGASVLDAGCGTGEKSLVFASLGAKVTGIDYNEEALRRARHLASISVFSDRLDFHQSSLPELPEVIRDREFDICHVDGVLHSVPNPAAALDAIAERVAPGGWLVLRNYQSITSFQRLLKRMIVRLGAGEDDEIIAANTKRLFREDIQRSVMLGGRTEDQAIWDNFVNPLYVPFDHRTLYQLSKDRGFRVYAVSPAVDAPALVGPGSVTGSVHEAAELTSLLWAATASRAMIATEPASSFLERLREPLEVCADACAELENSLDTLINAPTPEVWDRVIEGAHRYLSASHTALGSVARANESDLRTFLEEIRKLQPLIRDHLESGLSVEALPETSILFRKLSGFPMAAWVLWRPDPPPVTPFRTPDM